ncbi:hypothetical protein JCM5353_008736, partial [Sporobolomyces roseus]
LEGNGEVEEQPDLASAVEAAARESSRTARAGEEEEELERLRQTEPTAPAFSLSFLLNNDNIDVPTTDSLLASVCPTYDSIPSLVARGEDGSVISPPSLILSNLFLSRDQTDFKPRVFSQRNRSNPSPSTSALDLNA